MEVVKSKHQGQQSGTNFTLGDDNVSLTSSYYKDYIETKTMSSDSSRGEEYVKPPLAMPPPCAKILLSREQFPTAHVATTTNRRDYRGCSASDAVYRERLRDLTSIKTLHMQNSVVFGPGGGAHAQFLSSAQEHYRNPADTAREIMRSGQQL
ncbi:uncharacterized protein LOC110976806 [Acanthaster planci]|uniref:Uncharacterized protein LOC110976806 n=1 Tax=Acanthaster planci TaxID=133434 RepID=A0A8B7XYX6_ACAPL|nr:uncharacterized protein LOC110976806 [Acanthaster planci]